MVVPRLFAHMDSEVGCTWLVAGIQLVHFQISLVKSHDAAVSLFLGPFRYFHPLPYKGYNSWLQKCDFLLWAVHLTTYTFQLGPLTLKPCGTHPIYSDLRCISIFYFAIYLIVSVLLLEEVAETMAKQTLYSLSWSCHGCFGFPGCRLLHPWCFFVGDCSSPLLISRWTYIKAHVASSDTVTEYTDLRF